MKSKKAQVEVQFNWIFVIIAGVVFLGFFFMMIGNQTSTNEAKVSASLSRQFKTRIESTTTKANIIDEISLPAKFETEFVCDTDKNLHYYSLNGYKSSDIKYDLIFAPTKMYDRNIYLWTRQWEIPNEDGFAVTNFLYLTNKLNAYVFVLDGNDVDDVSDSFRQLYYNFPQNVSIFHSGQDYDKGNYESYTFIRIGLTPSFPKSITDNDKFVTIKPNDKNNIFASGQVCFDNQADCSLYLGSASLYGAIVAEDKDYYECVMNKAFDKLRILFLFQYYAAKEFKNQTETELYCKNLLGETGAMLWLDKLAGPNDEESPNSDNEGLLETKFSDREDYTGNPPDVWFDELQETLTKIDNRNKVLTTRLTCMNLY